MQLPDVVTARLDWSTDLNPWPAPATTRRSSSRPARGQNAKLTLAVEVQAPTKPRQAADRARLVLVHAVRPAPHRPGDVHHPALREDRVLARARQEARRQRRLPRADGIEFAGPLAFVNTLKDIIPFDGFSDPPYLDVTAEGIKAGFDLAIPDLAVGVFEPGEHLASARTSRCRSSTSRSRSRFKFCTRENPFRLTVTLFGGGGFFGITITPDGVRDPRGSFEFGAAISIDFGVRQRRRVGHGRHLLPLEKDGHDATLTGYFRLRGEVDVLGPDLGVASSCTWSCTYEIATGKAVGRATLTIEVEVLLPSRLSVRSRARRSSRARTATRRSAT